MNKNRETAPVLFTSIFVLRTFFVIFPYTIMAVIGGKIFGPFIGIILSLIGVFLSSSTAFLISRHLGISFIEKRLKGQLCGLEQRIERNGFKIVILFRLSMLLPFDIVSFTAGLTKIKYRKFILGTVLGVIPEVVTLNVLGSNIGNPFSKAFYVSIVLLVVLMIFIPILIKRSKQLM
ncbi:MAG TPA: TVP38/TMEM64 family protein [Ignavibacteria bacterium]